MKNAQEFLEKESLALTATTQFATIDGKKRAYRQFGTGEHLVLVNRFRGVLDTWDPLFLDGLASQNTVTIFDYSGIGLSEGELPLNTIEVAKEIIQLLDYLDIQQFNVLGWSYGGLVTQSLMFQYPDRVLKTVLVGTNPPGNTEIPIQPIFFEKALKPTNDLEDEYVLFFEPSSEKSKQLAQASHERIAQRLDRSLIPATQDILQRYFAGSIAFREDKANFRGRYETLQTPVFIISGDNDISFAVENWFPLLKNAPTIQHLILHETGHGPQHQYPTLVSAYINLFLQQD